MLTAIADVLQADVVCVVPLVSDRLVSTESVGAIDGGGWPRGPAAEEVVASESPVCRTRVSPADLPPDLRDGGARSGAWIPLPIASEPAADLLILLRDRVDPFTADEVDMLSAVAVRMGTALEALDRVAAIERLAGAGPDLTRHVEMPSLLDEAVVLFRDLTGTDSAFVVTIDDGLFELAAYTGSDPSVPRRWPRTTTTMPNWDQLSVGRAYVGPRETIRDRPRETDSSPTVLCVPVMRDGALIALLGATGHRARSFGKTGVDVATIMANYLSVAMTNAELYRQLTGGSGSWNGGPRRTR